MLVRILISDIHHHGRPDPALPKPELAGHDRHILDSHAVSTPIPRQHGPGMTYSYTQFSGLEAHECHGSERHDVEGKTMC